MGGRGAYSRTNGFADGKTENEFINVGGKTVDGIKVLQNTKANNSSLPEYANTSIEYISYNRIHYAFIIIKFGRTLIIGVNPHSIKLKFSVILFQNR